MRKVIATAAATMLLTVAMAAPALGGNLPTGNQGRGDICHFEDHVGDSRIAEGFINLEECLAMEGAEAIKFNVNGAVHGHGIDAADYEL